MSSPSIRRFWSSRSGIFQPSQLFSWSSWSESLQSVDDCSPLSRISCSVDRHPWMNSIRRHLKGENASDRLTVTKIDDLLFEKQRWMKVKFLWCKDFWLFSYVDVPQPVCSLRNYSLSKEFLLDRRSERLYHSPRVSEENLNQWLSANSPYGESSEFLFSSLAKLTWKGRLFTSFLRYIFVLHFHHFSPRLFQMVNLLDEHRSTYLKEKNNGTLQRGNSLENGTQSKLNATQLTDTWKIDLFNSIRSMNWIELSWVGRFSNGVTQLWNIG